MVKYQGVKRETFLPWIWTEGEMIIKWAGGEVPIHAAMTTRVAPNQLIGGYTLQDKNGNKVASKICDPYSPTTGAENGGHVERQFWKEVVIEGMCTALDAFGVEGDEALAVVEIHQWFTPCGGPKGCTRFLDEVISEANGWYKGVLVVGRFKAEQRYGQSMSTTHPRRPSLTSHLIAEIETGEAESYEVAEPLVVHFDPNTWG